MTLSIFGLELAAPGAPGAFSVKKRDCDPAFRNHMNKTMNLLWNLAKLFVVFSFGPAAWAADIDPAEKTQQEIQLKVRTIHASNEADCVDPKVSAIKQQLDVIKYRCFRLIREDSQRVPWHADAAFQISGGRSLIVVPQEFRNRRISLKVSLLEENKSFFETTVRLSNRGTILLGGAPHKDGVLILIISAMTE